MSLDADLLTVSQIVARLPGARGARRVHPATVVRWITGGCPARDGTRVKLPATRAGSRWLVRPADLEAFFAALTADPGPATTPPRSPAAANKATEAAVRELQRRGG
jgi:hypothetical protein